MGDLFERPADHFLQRRELLERLLRKADLQIEDKAAVRPVRERAKKKKEALARMRRQINGSAVTNG